MNGSRSTFKRKGYLLTALAAAVLLAASPGIASAQSVGFVGGNRTMGEDASPAMDTAAPIEVEINISGLTLTGAGANAETGLGTLSIQHNADDDPPGAGDARTGDDRRIWVNSESAAFDAGRVGTVTGLTQHTDSDHSHLYGVANNGQIPYDTNGVISLILIDPGGDDDWVDTTFTMTLRTDGQGVTPSPATVRVTITDNDPQPTVSFSKTSVNLTEDSQTSTPIGITIGAGAMGATDDPGGLTQLTNNIRIMAAPAGAVAVATDQADTGCDTPMMDPVIAVSLTNLGQAQDAQSMNIAGTYQASEAAGSLADNAPSFSIQACMDDDGFRNEMVTFSFVESSLTGAPMGLGNIAAGNQLVVTVQSEGEETPVVTFATTSIAIDEGDTNTVAILADGDLGPEVGSVMVSVSGDAALSLWQDDDPLEANDYGNYEVDLMGSANTILTISADSDRALEDGMTATGTITLESANGADIGDRDSVTVTVTGSTAVPALPLVGQLLLALFLMAGGARLYRRRNG